MPRHVAQNFNSARDYHGKDRRLDNSDDRRGNDRRDNDRRDNNRRDDDRRGKDRRDEDRRDDVRPNRQQRKPRNTNRPLRVTMERKRPNTTDITNQLLSTIIEQANQMEVHPYRSVLRTNSAGFDTHVGTLQRSISKLRHELGMHGSPTNRNEASTSSAPQLPRGTFGIHAIEGIVNEMSSTPYLDNLPKGSHLAMQDLDDRIHRFKVVYPEWKNKVKHFIEDTLFYAKLMGFAHQLADWRNCPVFGQWNKTFTQGNKPATAASFLVALYPSEVAEIMIARFNYDAPHAAQF